MKRLATACLQYIKSKPDNRIYESGKGCPTMPKAVGMDRVNSCSKMLQFSYMFKAIDPEEGPKGMADVMETGGSVDWQKRCVALETQLLKFRLQASKIRELLAERVHVMEEKLKSANVQPSESENSLFRRYQELSSQAQEKDEVIQRLEVQLEKQNHLRAQEAKIIEEKAAKIKEWVTFKLREVHVMEEKLKSANVQPSESENSLFRRYQELSSQAQEKDEVIQRLEVQLEKQNHLRAQEAKIIEEKAAKIKEWVTFKLQELEIENHHLKLSNLKQSEQIQVLRDKIQALLEGPGSTLGTGSPPHDNPAGVTALSSLVYSPGCPTSPTAVEEGRWQHSVRFLPSPTPNTQDLKKKGAEVSESQKSCPTSPLVLAGSSSHENHDPISKSPCSVRKQTSPVAMVTAEDEVLVKAKDVQASPKSGSCSPQASLELVARGFGPELPEGLIPEVQQQLEVIRDAHSPPEKRCVNRCLERDNSFDELNSKFCSQCLHCSSSPSKANMPSLIVIPALTPKHYIPSLQPAFPSAAPSGTSMTLPKVRTPLTPRDSIQLAKKHYSQPQPGADRLHHINVSIDISSFKPIALPPQCTLEVEETDIDEVPDKMDMEDCEEGLREERISFIPLPEELEFFDVDVKPPTPPLHRFPSWKATQISNIPFPDESSGSEDDTSSLASLRTSTLGPETKKSSTPGSPRATKRGVSMSSVSSESDYAIPPDAYSIDSNYSEPEHKLLRTSTYSCESNTAEPLEKSGYLLKMGSQVKAWKRRWFVLRNREILYYKSPSDVIRKPQGQIELNSSCRIARGEGAQTFQLITEKKTYYLTADSPNILEEWIRVLQNILKVQAASLVVTETTAKPTVKGWLTKVKHGHSKLVWCSLIGKVFYYYRNQDDKSCQLFINVLVESSSIDYHMSLAQNALQVCLTHPELQNEIYCQLIKQTCRRQPHNYSLIQCWQLLSLCVTLFLPQHRFLWYLKLYLQRHADPRNEVGKYIIYCQRSVERTLQNGDREAKPSRMEIMSILLRNPYHHSLPFSIPVHFMNGTYQVVGFDGSTTVDEFLNTLNQETGMRKPVLSGFALFTDDPSGKDLEHCLQGNVKFPLGQLRVHEARVQEVDRSCDSDEDYEAGGRGFLSSHCTLVVYPKEQSPTYLLIGTKQEKDTWLYHLTVAAGSSGGSKVGTEYEQLIGKLLDQEGDPALPDSCQLFINVLVESSSIDYHMSLAQNALQVCLTHPELQNEIYCQLIKQTCRRQPHNYSLIQCWQLLSLCVTLFLPQHRFLWYLKLYLQRHADPRNEVGKYVIYCQRSVERTLQNGDREAKPSRMEIMSILLRNPYHHSLPFSIPVHFMNGTYQVVGFDGSTTVDEFLNTLNQETGMRKPVLSGFALFTDDPSGKDLEHCLQGNVKICDVISKWEQSLKELHPGKYEGTRIVRLTYKSRMCFRAQSKRETERERLLLAYQINDDVVHGRFPVNKELALEVTALMAQVEYGDLDRPVASSPGGTSQAKMQLLLLQALEKFYPKRYKQDSTPEQLRRLADRVATKWMVLRGCSAAECVRIYLTVARKWSLFGAKLFTVKPVPPSPLEEASTWLAVSEDGVSVLEHNTMRLVMTYPYQSVRTFGGCCDDFMIVVSQPKDRSSGKRTVEKLVFAMAKPKILEVTLLIASYINYWTNNLLSSCPHSPNPGSHLGTMSEKKLWDIDSRHFPSMTRTTKGPTLL
ncbi:UNVERIFIED_CONTAM: hypothetical protein FKN15_032577 [Acipenser sinensis]